MVKIKRALISVSDKKGLDDFVKGLNELGVEILSTGGTSKRIASLGVPVKDVSSYTGFPEMLDGRVKTLHPKVHGGLLALREKKEHMEQIKKHGIELIDMVVVNLYPFKKTIEKPGVKFEEAIENIDIGGPSMLRSAAKNFRSVIVVCNPDRYKDILAELKSNGGTLSQKTLEQLAIEVFEQTSRYDAMIYDYLANTLKDGTDKKFPDTAALKYKKAQDLRYGENPHQKAAFYKDEEIKEPSASNAKQLQGKELSFNNIIDLNGALEIVKEFDKPAVSVIKHTNPCGAASNDNLGKAYLDALDSDRLSAFGSIVGLNRPVDKKTAETIMREADFVECIIAPSYSKEALAIFQAKKNLRIMEVSNFNEKAKSFDNDMKKVVGGMLIQDRDVAMVKPEMLKVVTKKKPTQEELESLLFGWKICKHVKSNAIVFSKGTKTVGVGAGQMSRVDSVIIASRKAGDRSKGATLASDAFFPKPDGIEMAAKAGITAIIQPGGSIKDEDVIKAADSLGIAMVFTGMRHFKH
ncbi:MAG: bifunctional phosphoribosylaminoimidazolecarboxamide formyltransferase/IMP cyclohydrolase [Candidatus Omnitrophica bacterium]|nr:bifunctional phosphoribosylaminoimidazolecarboxamide formyltransferase/IMP cyclohydrolase [Candidatus Omnitrophota bacterium]